MAVPSSSIVQMVSFLLDAVVDSLRTVTTRGPSANLATTSNLPVRFIDLILSKNESNVNKFYF